MPLLIRLKQQAQHTSATKFFLSLLFIVAMILSFTQTVDTYSKQHIDQAFNRALITFGISKSLNAVISVAQGTEIAIQPAGIGINFTPGQILDPVNDLVERFSWVMLASSTSLGIQKVFLTMSVWPAFSYLLVTILFISLVLLHTKTFQYHNLRIFTLRISLILIVLRFAVPVSGLANEYIYRGFLQQDYITSSKSIEVTTEQINKLNENEKLNAPGLKNKSAWESAIAFYNSTSDMLNINKRIDEYKQAAKESTQHIINLIIVFVFQTVLIPLAFFFIVYYLCRSIIRMNLSIN